MKTETLRRAVILLVLLAGIAAAIALRKYFSVELLTESVGKLGWLAPLVFIAGYAIATVFFFPGPVVYAGRWRIVRSVLRHTI